LDRCCDHSLVTSVEVVDAKKEANPARVLVSDDCSLTLAVGTSQQQARLGTRRTNHDPALRLTIGGHGRRIFHELEPQDVDKEPNRRLILTNHNRDEVKKSHRGILASAIPTYETCSAGARPW